MRAKMPAHDDQVGVLLKNLDELGVADKTIVIDSPDQGNELRFWPDGGCAPFRGEKGPTCGGGLRVSSWLNGRDTFLRGAKPTSGSHTKKVERSGICPG